MEKTKVTKKEFYGEIIAKFEGSESAVDVTAAEVIEFCKKEIAALDRKAEKARENAAKKKVEGDALTDAVFAVLTDEATTIADVTAKVESEDATPSKVGYRLRVLAETGRAIKEEITVPGVEGAKARKLVAYRLAD